MSLFLAEDNPNSNILTFIFTWGNFQYCCDSGHKALSPLYISQNIKGGNLPAAAY